jgi:RNA polymerase sigma factor (sigma-70 family)
VKPPSEIAAQLRELSDTEPRKPLEDELACSLRSWLERELKKRCSRAGVTADLEDATHELFLKLFENIRTGTPPPQHGREDAYVVRTAHNKANDILKGKGRFGFRKHLDSPDSISRATSGQTHEDAVEAAELAAVLREAIEELHPNYREVLQAHYFEQMPLVDIARQWHEAGRADTYEKAKQNVQKAASNGRKRIRVLIAEKLDGGGHG